MGWGLWGWSDFEGCSLPVHKRFMKQRKRNRLKGYDYSRDNLYFVTICVQGRLCCFGEIDVPTDVSEGTARELSVRGAVRMINSYGIIVEDRMRWLESQYAYIIIHNFVIMPNHVHAIVEIDSIKVKGLAINIKSLSGIIGAFKTTSSKRIHDAGFLDFAWQRSFHDHIIRSEKSYRNIVNYIDENPARWLDDTFFESC